jgi:glycine cleavage system aminomethyltransferase T
VGLRAQIAMEWADARTVAVALLEAKNVLPAGLGARDRCARLD